jgi:hypothetical protein
MSTASTRKVNLVAVDPDGGRHTVRTAADYTVAGLAKIDGKWSLLAKGWSWDSVRSRTITKAPRDAVTYQTGFVEEAPVAIMDYAGGSLAGCRITATFTLSAGWKDTEPRGRAYPSKSKIAWLAEQGVHAVAVTFGGRTADFQMTELRLAT